MPLRPSRWLAAAAIALALPALAQQVRLQTTEGDIVVELDAAKAPKTVDNFLQYVNSGFYNCTVFHRLVPGFVLQGGGFATPLSVSATALNSPKPTNPPIVLEDNNGLSNLRWTLAMARTGLPDSATSQFFVNLADNGATQDRAGIRRGFAVFGSITSGTEVITAAAAATGCVDWGWCLLVLQETERGVVHRSAAHTCVREQPTLARGPVVRHVEQVGDELHRHASPVHDHVVPEVADDENVRRAGRAGEVRHP